VDPWGVEKDELPSFHIFDAEDSVPRRLRPFGNDGNFITEETIEKSRFPDIRPSQDGDIARFERYHIFVMSSEFLVRSIFPSPNSCPRVAASVKAGGTHNAKPFISTKVR
jgi:hypothetical protein